MKRNFVILTILSILLVVLSACSDADEIPDSPDGVSAATEARYQEKEVREYEGVRLDPAIGPRDNSIAGVQEVDIDTYELNITGLVNEPATYRYDEVLEKESHQRLIDAAGTNRRERHVDRLLLQRSHSAFFDGISLHRRGRG